MGYISIYLLLSYPLRSLKKYPQTTTRAFQTPEKHNLILILRLRQKKLFPLHYRMNFYFGIDEYQVEISIPVDINLHMSPYV